MCSSNQPAQLQGQARILRILRAASVGIIHSRRCITKSLIRMRGCAGWSAPLLFAYNQVRVSNVETNIIYMGPKHAIMEIFLQLES